MVQSSHAKLFEIPEDLQDALTELARSLGETASDIVIASVDHFLKLPKDRQRAVMKAVTMRRRR